MTSFDDLVINLDLSMAWNDYFNRKISLDYYKVSEMYRFGIDLARNADENKKTKGD